MTKDQKIVAAGSFSGIASMIAAVAAIYHVWPANAALTGIEHRLAYALQADVFAVLPLPIGIVTVANGRFLSEAIDPTPRKENIAMQINGRVVDNTVQQYLLFLIGTLSLSVNLDPGKMRLIPAAVIVFVVARAAFWIGYRIHPLYRACGMSATIYLNIFLLAFAIWRMAA